MHLEYPVHQLADHGLAKTHDIQISMYGKGYYLDNIVVERLWRTVM